MNHAFSRYIHLSLLLFCGIHNGGATHFCNLPALAIKRPTADLVPNHVFDEQDPAVESQRQLVKQLDVFQHVVIRIAVCRIHKIIR